MPNPRPGPGVCRRCCAFTEGYELCYQCSHTSQLLQAVAPISYSIDGEQLHTSWLATSAARENG